MRIILLADISSEHTEKWALALAHKGVEVGLFSFNKASYPWYENQNNITVLHQAENELHITGILSKLLYIKKVFPLKNVINTFQPDILHAHYATSYGLIGALSGFKPFVISAWGTDVMKFPQENFINKLLLKFNLKRANIICATSHTISGYLKIVTNKPITVIPFGVDTAVFYKKESEPIFEKDTFVIGCIKSLEKVYNIDVLIKSFAVVKHKYPEKKIKLLIVGKGLQEDELKSLSKELHLNKDILFTGRVPYNNIQTYFNQLDVLINISSYESFGVSVIEAMACKVPVIATNTGGLKEIIETERYGSLVEVDNIIDTAEAIEKFLLNEELRLQIGENGYQKVIQKYNWSANVNDMITLYQSLLKQTQL